MLEERLWSRTPIPVGARFGKLVVTSGEPPWQGKTRVFAKCDCGNITVVILTNLKSGNSRSCGCMKVRSTHGLTSHPSYRRWKCMVHRCTDPRDVGYARYGGRGIKVHSAWLGPAAFLDYLDTELGPCPPGCTLDRIDNDGNYEPGNIRWATADGQYLNSRRTWRPSGERSGRSKLTETQAREILELHSGGASQTSLACQYSVSVPTISMLVNRKTWRHLS